MGMVHIPITKATNKSEICQYQDAMSVIKTVFYNNTAWHPDSSKGNVRKQSLAMFGKVIMLEGYI